MLSDKDSLLNQTFRLENLLPGPSAYFLVKSGFSKNPAKSVEQLPLTLHPEYLVLPPLTPQVISARPGLPCATILLGQFSQNPVTGLVVSS